MVIRFGTIAPPPWCLGGSQWVDGKGAGLKAVACTSDQSDRWSSRVVGDPRGCREIYRPDGALAAGETLLGSLRWGDLEGSKDWGAFGHCRGHALARGCIAQGKLVVTCRATARLHSETSSASWPFCASLVTSADAPASIFAAPPERVYVIEIKAAYPPRPNWQRIFDNVVFLHFASVSRGPPGRVRSVRCLGWLVVRKRGGSDLGRATRTGPVQGNLRVETAIIP